MAWGKSTPADPEATARDLLAKAASTGTLVVLPFRKFGDAECVALCAQLAACDLNELQASGHAIGEVGAQALGGWLGDERCALRRIAIGDASFGAAGLRALATGMRGGRCPLHSLDLSLKGLKGSQSGDALAALLASCTALRELSLARNPSLGSDGLAPLAMTGVLASPLGTTLLSLDLSDAGLDDTALGLLADAASSPIDRGALQALQTLKLSHNPLIGTDGGGSTIELEALLRSVPSVRALHLESCALGHAAAASIGRAVGGGNGLGGAPPPLAELCELRLGENSQLLRSSGPPSASEASKRASMPRAFIHSAIPTRAEYEAALQLPPEEGAAIERAAAERAVAAGRADGSDGPLGNAGADVCEPGGLSAAASVLLDGIRGAPKLSTLSLAACAAGDSVAAALAGRARAPWTSPLTSLDMRSNALSAKGARSLLRLPQLESLALFDNPQVGMAGGGDGSSLASGLDELPPMSPLRHLDLGACGIGIDLLRAFSDALTSGSAPQLRTLELFGNGTDDETRVAWLDALAGLREARPDIDIAWKEPAGDAAP